MKGFFAHTIISVFLPFAAWAQTPCDWINPAQTYFRIPVFQTGLYRIAASELAQAGIPTDVIPSGKFQIFRHGRELAIDTSQDSTANLSGGDYLTFYGKRNDGTADSALYIRPVAMPHSYYSLYSDTASYFLTWRTDSDWGKRMKSHEAPSTFDTTDHHIEESIQLQTSFYAPGNFYPPGSNFETGILLSTYDTGEGWTGREIKYGEHAIFTLQTEYAIAEHFNTAQAEITITGRSAGLHEVEIRSGTSPFRTLNKMTFTDYDSQTIKVNLSPADLDARQKVEIQIALTNTGNSVSVSAIRWRYPQGLLLSGYPTQKVFHFDTTFSSKSLNIKDGRSLYDCSDAYNVRRILTLNGKIAIAGITQIISANHFFKVSKIRKCVFQNIDSVNTDYLIISHPMLRSSATDGSDPVQAYAEYRSSARGGSFHPLVLNIQEVYDRFNYGDAGPQGIKNLIKWLKRYSSLQFVFIIGKSIDPQTARKLTNGSTMDMVPNAGWPGSDLALAMGTGTKPEEYIPSTPVGRINASTSAQVWAYLEKVKSMEAEPSSARWRKNILHLSGGRSISELSLFRSYVNSFETKIKNTGLAASVSTISKKTDDPVEQFPLDEPINDGVALLTLFGHSGLNITDLDIGYASDPGRNYNNKPRYPAVIVNGCATGSIFYSPTTISSDWIFSPESGSVLFLAHTFNGVSTSLKRYTDSFYEVLADSAFTSAPFGTIQIEAIRRNMLRNPGIADLTTAQQMNLHGDPAIRIFPTRLPDYRFDSTLFAVSGLQSAILSPKSDSLLIRIGVENNGRFQSGKYNLSLTETQDSVVFKHQISLNAVLIADTLSFALPNRFKTPGIRQWRLSLDPDNEIREENESNNSFSTAITMPAYGPVPLLPLDGFITNQQHIELIAELPEWIPDTEVTFEWDTSETFSNSNTFTAIASEKIARHEITIAPDFHGKIYWRVYLPGDPDSPSRSRSITSGEPTGPIPNLPEVLISVSDTWLSVAEGDSLHIKAAFRNITSGAFTDSVTVILAESALGKTGVHEIKISPLTNSETRNFEFKIPTRGKTGLGQVLINFNTQHLPEHILSNNTAAVRYEVTPDLIPPVITVSVDERQIYDNEVISESPLIAVQVIDENPFLIRTDTTGIYIGIRAHCPGCSESRVSLQNASISKTKPNRFLIKTRPQSPLKAGSYDLIVKARDMSENMALPYQIGFRVSENQLVAEAGVSPNPSHNYFRFYLDIEGSAFTGTWLIRLTDISGNEIEKLETKLHLGRNELFWKPENHTQKIIIYQMELSGLDKPLSPAAQSGMNGKLIWIP